MSTSPYQDINGAANQEKFEDVPDPKPSWSFFQEM
jgi:hypothetical protein